MALANAYYSNIFRSTSAQISDESSPEIDYTVNDESETSEKAIKNLAMSQSSSISSPSSTNSSGYNNLMHGGGVSKSNLQFEETHSVINFKNRFNNFVHAGGFLNFEQNEQSTPNLSPKFNHQNEYSIWADLNCGHSSSNSYEIINTVKQSPQGEEGPFGWMNSDTNGANKDLQGNEMASFTKRPFTGESTQAQKKQCGASATKKQPKQKSTPSKDPQSDPQSVAAKNRRERISERLKVLQELVPNGTKVDLVTMLEKAIGYVKFLQLQVKVLAADEFWPAQGGKAPDLSQVKDALDAILSTQRERSSSSK